MTVTGAAAAAAADTTSTGHHDRPVNLQRPYSHPHHQQQNRNKRRMIASSSSSSPTAISVSVSLFLSISMLLAVVATMGQIWISTMQFRFLLVQSTLDSFDFDSDDPSATTSLGTPENANLAAVITSTKLIPETLTSVTSVSSSQQVTTEPAETRRRTSRASTSYNKSEDDNDPNAHRAIFVISMGGAASRTHLVERFIYSARTKGQYDGWIVLLTDAAPSRYQKLKDWNYNSNNTSNNRTTSPGDERFIIIKPRAEHYNSKFKRKDMTIKRFKTYVIDYIDMLSRDDDSKNANNITTSSDIVSVKADKNMCKDFQMVKLIYYLDVDIVFAGPLSTVFDGLEHKYGIGQSEKQLAPMPNNRPSSKLRNSISPAAPLPLSKSMIYMFEGNFANYPIQGGQMILDRAKSGGCLTKWRTLIDKSPRVKKDQVPLMGMYNSQLGHIKKKRKNELDCYIVKMDQKPYISFPDKEYVNERVLELMSTAEGATSTDLAGIGNFGNATRAFAATALTSPIHLQRYTNMVHVRNTAQIGMSLNDTTHKIWLRDVLGMTPEDKDPFGILLPGHMRARRRDQLASRSTPKK